MRVALRGDGMQAHILSLFAVCLSLGLGELLLCGEEKSGTRRALRLFAALLVLLLILAPFIDFLKSCQNFFGEELVFEESALQDWEQVFSRAVAAQSEKDLKSGIQSFLEKEYGIAAQNCTVLVYLDGEGALQSVSVFLSGAALTLNPDEVARALAAQLHCTVEVR